MIIAAKQETCGKNVYHKQSCLQGSSQFYRLVAFGILQMKNHIRHVSTKPISVLRDFLNNGHRITFYVILRTLLFAKCHQVM